MLGTNITQLPSSSVLLPTTGTITAPTSSQIGYTQKTFINSGFTTLGAGGSITLASLTLIGPVGSVWIIWGGVEFSTSVAGGYVFGLHRADTVFSANSSFQNYMISGSIEDTNICKPKRLSTTGVYSLQSGLYQNIITLGIYPYVSGFVPSSATITATRIA